MTSLFHKPFALIVTVAISLPFACASHSQAQDVEMEDGIVLEDGITLDTESILGELGEEQAMARLFDKSTIANLEFLNSGQSPTSVEQLKAMQDHVAELYERVEPAVVNIRSGMGQGSGVVVTSDGYILTAAHVISVPNRSAVITFPDGTRARAQTLGLLRSLDAGLLKIYRMEEVSKDVEEEGEKEADDEQADGEDKEEPKSDNGNKSEDGADSESDTEPSQEESSEEGTDESEMSDEKDEVPSDESGEEESDKKNSDDRESDEEDSDEEDLEDENDSKPKKKKKSRFEVQDDLPSFDYLDIGDSAELNLGQWVVAVGHPGGLDEDRGIVLRVGRINEIEAEQDDAYVRTDCTLVGGDSGGPLIGMDGSVIGIHSRIGARLKQNFHVPSNEFIDNWTSLMEPVVHDRDAQLNLGFRSGTNVISSVPEGLLADRSGLKVSDRIIRIGDKQVYDKLQFDDAISDLKPYQVVEFEVQRKGKNIVLDVTIGEKPRRFGFR